MDCMRAWITREYGLHACMDYMCVWIACVHGLVVWMNDWREERREG